MQTATGEQQLPYDYLIYALGSQVERHTVPGVNEYAYTLDSFGDLTTGDLTARLEELADKPFRAIVVSGAQAVDNIVAEMAGRKPQPLSFAWYGQAIALGPRDAAGFATYPADVPVGPIVLPDDHRDAPLFERPHVGQSATRALSGAVAAGN